MSKLSALGEATVYLHYCDPLCSDFPHYRLLNSPSVRLLLQPLAGIYLSMALRGWD